MILLDVNVLIYAHRAEMPEHPAMIKFLTGLIGGDVMFGIPNVVFASLVRIATQPSWKPPSTPAQALDFCNSIQSSPHCLVVEPSKRHWEIFDRLCRSVNARGKLVADAYLAAFALDRDDQWVTCDKDYARFPGLRWRNPLDGQLRTNPR